MAKTNASIPQGTRDFGPDVVRKRDFIFDTIKNVFELYGFQPLETPAMENLETLMGKYGEEGDKLIYRILDSGNPFSKYFFEELVKWFEDISKRNEEFKKDYPKLSPEINFAELPLGKLNPESLEYISKIIIEHSPKLKNEVSGKALRYDLTIPFARYVAMNHGQLTYPFKRYQIQPVWRADRPQKGRYREFYQCDADVVGSVDLVTELELLKIYDQVFTELHVPNVEIRINSRAILKGLSKCLEAEEKIIEITSEIDKIDKVGIEKVKESLFKKGLNESQLDFLEKYLTIKGKDDAERINNLYDLFKSTGKFEYNTAYAEIFGRVRSIIDFSKFEGLRFKGTELKVDFALARGLNYYTGLIVEVKCSSVKIGSLGGGGTYHNLTALFGIDDLPGVGISFGVDRIYDVLDELDLFPKNLETAVQVLFFNLGSDPESNIAVGLNEVIKCMEIAGVLRSKGISCEIYPKSGVKFDKQFKYAQKKNIPYAIIIGQDELQKDSCQMKNLVTGHQSEIAIKDLIDFSFGSA